MKVCIIVLQILSLESHLEKRRGTEAWDNCQEKVIGVAKRTLGECNHRHLLS